VSTTAPPDRPDPDALLARVTAEEQRQARARFKVFFGFAPGVGKTYRMLQVARDLIAEGVDFTIGEAHVRYHAPLRFDEEFDIKVRVGEIRHSSWAFEYAVDRADGLHCADVSTVQVVIGKTMRAQRMPDHLKLVLERAKGA